MNQRFAGKTALVTGGGTGIGRATARAFASEGANVVVAGRRPEPLEETVAMIERDGGAAAAIPTDVTDEDQVRRLVESTVARFGGLDVAFNNAGVGGAGPLADMERADFESIVNTIVLGTWLSMKHELAHMREAGGGAIVNMASSIGPHGTLPALGAYAAAKAAVASLTRTAALEHVADGIRVNSVSPGPVDTPILQAFRATMPTLDLAGTLVGRHARPQEIAAVVAFLLSPEASWVNGIDLRLDGGLGALRAADPGGVRTTPATT